VAHKKVKFLNSGEYKRLSIAEEIVHGPKLLLIDEPITGVSLRESSILLNTFREMVNADRTVICSMYHPSVEAFNLFDSLLLLSKGRVIYSGRIGAATEFFTQSPYQYSLAGYTNPADFLADISSSQLPDSKVNTLRCDFDVNPVIEFAASKSMSLTCRASIFYFFHLSFLFIFPLFFLFIG